MAVWALIGFMGCGKSSIGRAVANMLGVGGTTFIDLDEEIVRRAGRSIPELFATDGEAAFRAIEKSTLTELLSADGVPPGGRATRGTEAGGPSALADGGVSEANSPRGNDHLPTGMLLALGGGTLMNEECRELIRKGAKCIYLRASVETLAANLRDTDITGRPMLAGVDPAAPADAPDSLQTRIAAMMATRGPVYEKAADIILDIDGLSYEEVALQILNSFSR